MAKNSANGNIDINGSSQYCDSDDDNNAHHVTNCILETATKFGLAPTDLMLCTDSVLGTVLFQDLLFDAFECVTEILNIEDSNVRNHLLSCLSHRVLSA